VGTLNRQSIRTVADVLWALGEGNEPRIGTKDALKLVHTALTCYMDNKLKGLLEQAKAQLQKQTMDGHELRGLSSDIHQALA
jgi:hypothetical protein